jgi:hypothetical protein
VFKFFFFFLKERNKWETNFLKIGLHHLAIECVFLFRGLLGEIHMLDARIIGQERKKPQKKGFE